jgi:hypothetical protein
MESARTRRAVAAAAIAVTSITIGAQWDVAWHRSIGRDGLWSPPHLAIYLGAVLAGITAAWLILSTTFGRDRDGARAASVRVWGFRGPLGAFVAAWGGVAMLASAPFDDWWHNTYGLDVRILSPPHTLLALGIFGVGLGVLMVVGGLRNREPERALWRWLYLYIAGLLLVMSMTFLMEYTFRTALHSATAYRVIAMGAPLVLIGGARASGVRWGATAIAGVYTAVYLAMLWLFPLVPATPKLGPVFFPVTRLVPAGFPILLIAPALVIDAIGPRLEARPRWQRALAIGVVFVAVLLAAQWPLASFLVSPSADNWIFGSAWHDYNSHPSWAEFHHTFWQMERTRAAFAVQLAIAFGAACVMSWVALVWGESMRRLRR